MEDMCGRVIIKALCTNNFAVNKYSSPKYKYEYKYKYLDLVLEYN